MWRFMDNLGFAAVLGTLAGVAGTGIGALAACALRIRSGRALGFVLQFAAGLMLAVACLELLPEAFMYGSPLFAALGVLLGVLAAVLMQSVLKHGRRAREKGRSSMLATGIITAVGIAAHNLPEGLAIGSGLAASAALGLGLATVIVAHDLPEGMAMAAPMLGGGMKPRRVMALALLAGLPTGLGAVIGAALGGVSESVVGFCLALAAGTMLYISLGDLIPEAGGVHSGRLPAVGAVLGVLLGFAVSRL